MAKNLKCATATRVAPVWIAVALAAATVAVFCPVTGFQFVSFDDPEFVTGNPHVQAGLTAESFKWAWGSVVTGDWHPITMLSLMLDCQLFGIKSWWPHLINLLLHAANTVLLFALFKRMTGALWRSAIVAALFALHPLHVESVAWVSERKDVLSTLFWFLTTWAYVRYADKCRVASGQWPVFYGLSLLFFALGLMSKPMLVTLPCTLLLLDYWPLGRIRRWRLVWEKIPFFAMSAALCVVTITVQKHTGGIISLRQLPLGERLGNALVSYARYIGMTFWPRNLAGFYPIRSGSWPWWAVTLAGLLLLVLSALVLAQWRRRACLAVGWCWFLGTLVPVIGLVQVFTQSMADRFTYVPLIGLFVAVVWGGWELAGAWGLRRFAPAATVAALLACAALTVHQEFYWKDSATFYKRMLDVTSNNYLAHYNLGVLCLEANRTNEVLPHFLAAVEENPHFARARCNLGTYYIAEHRTEEGISNLMAAVKEDAHYAEPHYNLGLVFQAQGRTSEAVAELEQAARLDSNQVVTWTQLAAAYARQNKMPEAEQAFRQWIRLQPGNASACSWLGGALSAQNKLAEAVPFYLTALKLNPADFSTEYYLARTLSLQGKRGEAAEHYRQALRINPNFAEAQMALSALGSQTDPPHENNR